jgi:hypothetical protein
VIRHGRNVDGTVNPRYVSDVAIRRDHIAPFGRTLPGAARRETAPAGLFVDPASSTCTATPSTCSSKTVGTDVIDSVKEAIAVADRADIPVDTIHLTIAERSWRGRMNEIVPVIEEGPGC